MAPFSAIRGARGRGFCPPLVFTQRGLRLVRSRVTQFRLILVCGGPSYIAYFFLPLRLFASRLHLMSQVVWSHLHTSFTIGTPPSPPPLPLSLYLLSADPSGRHPTSTGTCFPSLRIESDSGIFLPSGRITTRPNRTEPVIPQLGEHLD